MPNKSKDISGFKSGTLTAIERVPHTRKDAMWRCVCDCGCGNNNVVRPLSSITKGIVTCRIFVGKILVKCGCCNKNINIAKSKYDLGEGRYCSRDCYAKSKEKFFTLRLGQDEERKLNKKTIYKRKYPKKAYAHYLVTEELRKGKITRQSCEVCNQPHADAHHCDYNKPLDVMWLCKKHHNEWHKNNKAIE